jgi:Tfp pilus assembly protein PilE
MTSLAKGIIISVVAVVLLVVIAIGTSVSFHLWRAAKRSGNEAATVQNLKTIAAVQIQYYNTHNRTFGTFDQLIKDGLLDARFAGDLPLVDGYTFTLKVTTRTASVKTSYTLNADPQSGASGRNHFYLDSTSFAINVNADQPAGPNDPPLAP